MSINEIKEKIITTALKSWNEKAICSIYTNSLKKRAIPSEVIRQDYPRNLAF